MKKKGFSAEQIIGNLREADVLLSQGVTVGQVSRKPGVTEQTYYRWRREYGGMWVEQARRLKGLENPYPLYSMITVLNRFIDARLGTTTSWLGGVMGVSWVGGLGG